MFDALFTLNINAFATSLLPNRLRKSKMVTWVIVFLTPFKNLYNGFLVYRRSAKYKIEHTAEVFSMENVLNDSFDVSLRRIYIEDGIYINPAYFYEPEEDKPVRFYEEDPAVRFYEEQELENLDVDFVVVLPSEITLSAAYLIRLRSLIDFYKPRDKTYTLRYE